MTIRTEQDRKYWAHKAFEFIQSIGLPIENVSEYLAPESTFIPYVLIHEGGIKVCVDKVFPGELLHESGHLAILPPQFRKLANGSLSAAFSAASDYLEENPSGLMSYPEDAVARACIQCGEAEAQAWQYAAAKEFGMPNEWMFSDESLKSGADDVLFRLENNQHFGINGMRAAGWTELQRNPHTTIPVYPKLAFWLFPASAAA